MHHECFSNLCLCTLKCVTCNRQYRFPLGQVAGSDHDVTMPSLTLVRSFVKSGLSSAPPFSIRNHQSRVNPCSLGMECRKVPGSEGFNTCSNMIIQQYLKRPFDAKSL